MPGREWSALRRRMWEANPNCHWCGRPTIYRKRANHDGARKDDATIDHLLSKLANGGRRSAELVLACHECNGLRSNLEERATPELIKRHRSQGILLPVVIDNEAVKAELDRLIRRRHRRTAPKAG